MHHHTPLAYPILASLLAVFGSWTALDLFRRARSHDGTVALQWVLLSAVAMGVSIWSMHFIAMLGFDPGSPVSYDLFLTTMSLVLAMGGTAIAFAQCAYPGAPNLRLFGGGAIMGLSIGGMHYVGMAALRTAAVVAYRPEWVAASVVVAFVASTAALAATRRESRPGWRTIAAVVLGAGIVSMHYTAMIAVVLVPGGAVESDPGVPPLWLAFGVAGLTLLLLFLALGASLIDQRQALMLALRAGKLGYWEMDIPRRRLTLSEHGRVLLGFPPDQPFEQSQVPELLTSASAAKRSECLERSIAEGVDYEADYELRDGRWLEVRGRMLLDNSGRSQRLVGTIQDVTPHRAAYHALARSEARQRILINELNHRVKNTLATILSMATLTARKANTLEEFASSFEARVLSLSATHNLLTAEGWERAEVRSVFDAEFRHYDLERFELTGPQTWLPAESVLTVGLITHELVTNASKYGALSVPEGRVQVAWSVANGRLDLKWIERQGPQVTQPARQGFGSRLIKSSAHSATFHFEQSGFAADISVLLPD